jgi:hypothetical protein
MRLPLLLGSTTLALLLVACNTTKSEEIPSTQSVQTQEEAEQSSYDELLRLASSSENSDLFASDSISAMMPLVTRSLAAKNISQADIDAALADESLSLDVLEQNPAITTSLKTLYSIAANNDVVDIQESSFMMSIIESIVEYLTDMIVGLFFSDQVESSTSTTTTTDDTTSTSDGVDTQSEVATITETTLLYQADEKRLSFGLTTTGEYAYWAYILDSGTIIPVYDTAFVSLDASTLNVGQHYVFFALYDANGDIITKVPPSKGFVVSAATNDDSDSTDNSDDDNSNTDTDDTNGGDTDTTDDTTTTTPPQDSTPVTIPVFPDHAPQTGTSNKEIIEKLIDNASATTDINDAKLFSQTFRQGLLSLYPTNGMKNSFTSDQIDSAMNLFLPSASKEMNRMKKVFDKGMALGEDFVTEVNSTLMPTMGGMQARMDALSEAAAGAVNQMMGSDNYYGSATSSYGDTITLSASDINIDVCLVFFMCESNAKATVDVDIINNGKNGNFANINFVTRATIYDTSASAVTFSGVGSRNDVNSFKGDGYDLDIKGFEFNRGDGYLSANGTGTLSEIGSDSTKTVMTMDSYDIMVNLAQHSYAADLEGYSITGVNFDLDGKVDAKSGRTFVGDVYFDARAAESNHFSGTITGVDGEPVIEGDLNTTLTYKDAGFWITEHEPVIVTSGLPYLIDSNNQAHIIQTMTEFAGRYDAKDFDNNSYECNGNQAGASCTDRFNRNGSKTLGITKEGEVLVITINGNEYYVVNIDKVFDNQNSEFWLLKAEDWSKNTLDWTDWNQVDVSNYEIRRVNFNEDTTIDNIGDHIYALKGKIIDDDKVMAADMLMSRDNEKDQWRYYIHDLEVGRDASKITASKIFLLENGNHRYGDEINEEIGAPSTKSTQSVITLGDTDSIMGINLATFNQSEHFTIEDFKMTLPAAGSLATIELDIDIERKSDGFSFDIDGKYDFVDTLVDGTLKVDVVENKISDGSELLIDMHFEADARATTLLPMHIGLDEEQANSTDSVRYFLLQDDVSKYQLALKMDKTAANDKITAVDSYGIIADIVMDSDREDILSMNLKNSKGVIFGSFDKAVDNNIHFSDGSITPLF